MNDTWTIRSLPGLSSIIRAPDLVSGNFQYGKEIMLGCSNTTRVYKMDSTYQMWNGADYASFTSYVERKKLFVNDPFSDLVITGLAPIVEVSNEGDIVDFYVNSQNVFNKEPDYSNATGRHLFELEPKDENAGYRVNPRSAGRFLNMKVTSGNYWKLSYLGLDIKQGARR